MKEVIIERPRSGSRYTYKDFRRRPEGSLRGMKRPYGYDRKSQSDVLGPLKNFLKSRVGQPWNNVWSEICKANDSRSLVGSHLRDHIGYMVEKNVIEHEDGMFSYSGRYRMWPMRNTFYVNQNGILCYVGGGRPKYHKPESKIINFHGLKFYKHEGVWYEIEVQPITKKILNGDIVFFDSNRNMHYNRDLFGNHLYSWIYPSESRNSCFRAYGDFVCVVRKKQIGKRMIKKIERFISDKTN